MVKHTAHELKRRNQHSSSLSKFLKRGHSEWEWAAGGLDPISGRDRADDSGKIGLGAPDYRCPGARLCLSTPLPQCDVHVTGRRPVGGKSQCHRPSQRLVPRKSKPPPFLFGDPNLLH